MIPLPLDEPIETLLAVSDTLRLVTSEEDPKKLIVSPLATPAPVTAAESVIVVAAVDTTVVPAGMTPECVVSVTTIPAAIDAGTDAKVSVVPVDVAAEVTRLMLRGDPGGAAQFPLALKNIFASALPAAGAGTSPAAPPEPLSPAKGNSVRGALLRSVKLPDIATGASAGLFRICEGPLAAFQSGNVARGILSSGQGGTAALPAVKTSL
jgi:hypothetical protein